MARKTKKNKMESSKQKFIKFYFKEISKDNIPGLIELLLVIYDLKTL